jgi:hypothetical protein
MRLYGSGCGGLRPSESLASKIDPSFKPDVHITVQLPEDKKVLEKMRQLFFEADNTANPKKDVYAKSVREFGGQEIILYTEDDFRISALYFKRPNAKINLIYIPGYFFDLTPTKEWGAPFSLLFPEFNVLVIEWRGIGTSEGSRGFLCKNSFGKDAIPDIQAAIDFMRKENSNPNVLIGFCFGAAMVMHATVKAAQNKKPMADALVLNCLFTKFENQFNRSVIAEDRCLYRFLINTGVARWVVDKRATGSLFEVNPIDLIKDIHIPCYFEHFTYDPFAILEEGIEVFNAAACPKMFTQSDVGWHVRIHAKAPYQYRESFILFLRRFGLLKEGLEAIPAPLSNPAMVPAVITPIPAASIPVVA